MQISVLASGSKGNCTLIRNNNTAILIDVGLSARRIKQELSTLKMDIKDIDGILITHEHIDHIKGLKTLNKQYKMPIYTKANTFKAMPFINELDISCCNVIENNSVKIGDLLIDYFAISHDAVDPVGYNIKDNKQKCIIATDLGVVSKEVQSALNDADMIVLEANHDINLLQNGPYPWALKRRILGNKGHLSNKDAGQAINSLSNTPAGIILAHLSERNNMPQMALDTIRSIIKNNDKKDIPIYVASANSILSLDF